MKPIWVILLILSVIVTAYSGLRDGMRRMKAPKPRMVYEDMQSPRLMTAKEIAGCDSFREFMRHYNRIDDVSDLH